MLVFAAFGAAVGCWAGAIPQVMAAAGIDSYQLGLGLTASTLATVAAMALGGIIGRQLFKSRRAADGNSAAGLVTTLPC